MPLPTDPATRTYLFTDDMRFVLKAIVMHPREEKFLIIMRSQTEFVRPGTWDLPGGCLSYGELHRDALRREIFEEAGLLVEGIREAKVLTSFNAEQPMYFLLVAAQCRATSDLVLLSDEHMAYQWVTREVFLAMDQSYRYVENRELEIGSTHFLRDIVYECVCVDPIK